jgi:hypothetical protein
MARKRLMVLKERSTRLRSQYSAKSLLARGRGNRPRRHDGLGAADFEVLDEADTVIACVGEEAYGFDFLGQDLGLRCVVNVSAGEAHRQGIARRVDDGVNPGRPSSAERPVVSFASPVFESRRCAGGL